ncbi:MAG: acetyltransferase [endosymbiont of Galathealinum brachiosum]|uniref:Acetyltransferase n=1 Tax=endosymbiont of Galathealinum brachiosum TaxID=2200906 RepID=A0A370DL51_9GAMM|nr:MAG: acetyltransferase [endosymbiont of Galathealinum brachiosum]
MQYFDIFNGDADGICALHQMRLANPLESTLVTGVKRDINLLKKVQTESASQVLVLDISLDKNRDDLNRLLETGCNIQYFDHHFAGDIPEHENLQANINTDPNVCTSLLVNSYLNNRFLPWAVTAAFGDNLHQSAISAAKPLNLSDTQLQQLELLGTCINYNGYGSSLDDLIFTPDDLYRIISHYENPFEFIQSNDNYKKLESGYKEDVTQVESCKPAYETDNHSITILPNEKWARRVGGVYANQLATENQDRAHAMLTHQNDDSFLVSVRAPLNNKTGADELCRQFETGGGRKAAAGINKLPASDYDLFVERFTAAFV